ncbi:S41 family peptidase [Amycolatopsis benzoatilytica]|uniref:S41 family peptidase n=1 Tax=Amycolatopsis benzoatilytica TaxID=346045 RepID=UPI00039BC81C|nr:S41 family peptidase [Amycolatopsis benzoatilytica]
MRILLAGLALLSTVALPHSTVDGVWRTVGYGQLVQVSGGKLSTYDVTKVSCLPGSLSGTGDGTTFATNEGSVVTIRPGAMTFDDNLGVRSLRRVPGGLPRECRVPANELSTFDVFWHTFAENYPFFRAKGVDWQSEGDAARREVAAHPDRLYDVLCGLIRPLHDAHVALSAPGQHCASPRPGTPDPGKTVPRAIAVADANLGVPTRTWAGGALAYADLPGGLGYLRITGFHDYAGTFAESSKILAKALDEIFTPGHQRSGLILDLRVNGGGDDPLGLQVAARLTDVPHYAYAKRARNDPDDPSRFTVAQPFFVQPAVAPRYRGPLAVLTGNLDVSAGETFLQALLNRQPRPVLIGQSTQGAFSDTLDRALPKPGWTVSLPNEEYLDPHGRTYDGTGIGPDLPVPVFAPDDLAAGRDPALALARRVLGR